MAADYISKVTMRKVPGSTKLKYEQMCQNHDDRFSGLRYMQPGEEYFEDHKKAVTRFDELCSAKNNMDFYNEDGSPKTKG